MNFLYYDRHKNTLGPKQGPGDYRRRFLPIAGRPNWFFDCNEISNLPSDGPASRFFPTNKPGQWLELIFPILEIEKQFCYGPCHWWAYYNGEYGKCNVRRVSMNMCHQGQNWPVIRNILEQRRVQLVKLSQIKLSGVTILQ